MEEVYMCWKCFTFSRKSELVTCTDCKACKSLKKIGKKCLRKICPCCEGGTFMKV